MNPNTLRGRRLQQTQHEILREKAGTLAQGGERLEHVVAELITLRAKLAENASQYALGWRTQRRSPFSAGRTDETVARSQKPARRFRSTLTIQREACRFRRHEEVDRPYPIPDFASSVPEVVTEEGP